MPTSDLPTVGNSEVGISEGNQTVRTTRAPMAPITCLVSRESTLAKPISVKIWPK